MIYKDNYSQYDLEDMPADRDEDCLNCGQEHNDHSGWRCYNVPAITDRFGNSSIDFSDYLPTDKYFTQSMKDSIMVSNTNKWFCYGKNLTKTPPATEIGAKLFYLDEIDEPAHQTAKPTIDQWQAWAHNHPGDCACGIKRETCDYHR